MELYRELYFMNLQIVGGHVFSPVSTDTKQSNTITKNKSVTRSAAH